MSSTKRGGTRSEADWYPTPDWCVRRLAEVIGDVLPTGRWIEPAAGDGAIVSAWGKAWPLADQITWDLVELRPECAGTLKALSDPGTSPERVRIEDWLAGGIPEERYDVLMTNPPFRLAEDFLVRGLQVARIVVLLLRLNFLGTDRRHSLLQGNMPDAYILPNRPSFTSDGQTDSIEYAWFVWDVDRPRSVGACRLLDTTPKHERGNRIVAV